MLEKLSTVVGTFKFEWTDFDWSSKAYLERGWYMPEDYKEQLNKHDAIYFGAVGWPGQSAIQPEIRRMLTTQQMSLTTSPFGT